MPKSTRTWQGLGVEMDYFVPFEKCKECNELNKQIQNSFSGIHFKKHETD